ncbi:hypothetical protein BVF91_11645 [Thermoanaerobacterium sp. PSU-2]|uniref:hypothetical protein n=1 Tax=Thermoanaerobacterium sp. PSU-2 TaxID=1930849 RepID=UPI000A15C9A7|nr:hypothetical protein [Thermoanaerobacterium sp. PSU-2]ORX22486.1 hypothetical protein BVF91_11645 [Thermoanaerobacterium sp. PSU-2]
MDDITKSYYEMFRNWCNRFSLSDAREESVLLKFLREFLNEDEIVGFYYQQQELFVLTANGILKLSIYNGETQMHIIPLNLIKDIKITKKPNQIYKVLIIYNDNDSLSLKSDNESQNEALHIFIKHLMEEL